MTREIALSLAADLALRKRIPIAFFSLDRPAKDVIRDLLSLEAKIDPYRLANGVLGPEDFSLITEAAAAIFEAPFYIVDALTNIVKQSKTLMDNNVEVIFADSNASSIVEDEFRSFCLSWIRWKEKANG